MTCPHPQQLQHLLDETLPADQQPTIQAHLEICAACQKVLERLAAGGVTWDKTAQNLGEAPARDETALQCAVAKLQETPTSADPTQAESADKPIDDDLSFLQPSAKPNSLGRLDEYEILSVVGKGGFGIVLKAFDEELHRIVAIKVLSPPIASHATARERFIREAKAAAAITHENVVTIHRVNKAAKIPYLAMQFVSGFTLGEKLDKGGPLSVKEILRIGMQIAEGLAAAHKQGLVHRDIKPANVLLENGIERVKITDFGLARTVDDATVTQSGTVAGTPMYMSPEQANGEPVDHRSDLFSLGSVLYVMCTGRAPFRASTTMAVLRRVCDDTPTPVQQVNSEIPDWLGDIIAKLHAKRLAERFQSAKEVAELLGKHLAQIQQPTLTTPAHETITTMAAAPAAPSKTGRSAFRRMLPWLGAAGLVMGMLAIFLVLYSLQKPSVPMDAGDVLKRMVGTWSVEYESSDPKLKTVRGVVRYDWVANGKFLRAYSNTDDGRESLTMVRYDPDTKALRRWSFARWAFAVTPGPIVYESAAKGEWDANAATLTWRAELPLSHKVIHQEHWSGTDQIEWKTTVRNHQGDVVLEQTKKLARFTSNEAVGPKLPDDPKRPADLAVLERTAGKWTLDNEITLHDLGGRKVKSQSTQETTAFLAGHFFETRQRTQPGDREDYLITGYDENRKTYRFWHFGADGDALEADGTWDKAENKLIWKSLDGRLAGAWTFRGSDERHMTWAGKDAQGRRLYDVEAIARREGAVEPGWVQLFNGKDLTGWVAPQPGRGDWQVDKLGQLVGKGDPRSYLFTQRDDFTDFHLRAQLQVGGGSNGGICFRCGLNRLPLQLAPGYKASLSEIPPKGSLLITTPESKSGDFVAHASKTDFTASTWFTMEVIARGNRLTVKTDGKTVVEYTDDKETYKRGRIALETYAPETVITFKKVEIKELPPEEPGWVQLFNRKDLSGWKTHPDQRGAWKVENGLLTCTGPRSHLFSDAGSFENFQVRLEAKINKEGKSLLYFRTPFELKINTPLGYGALIGDTFPDDKERGPQKTGSLWRLAAQNKQLTTPNEWFTMEVIAQDNRLQVFVNGKKTADVVDEKRQWRRGHFALLHLAGTRVFFRKIEIKELPPSPPLKPPVPIAEKGVLDYAEIHDADEKRFDAWIARMRRDGYRPVSLSVQTVKDAPRYTSVAIKEEKKKVWEYARVRIDDGKKHIQDMGKKDFVAIAQCVYREHRDLRQAYLWVLNPNASVDGIWAGSKEAIDNKIEEARIRKARPVYRSAFEGAVIIYDIILGAPGNVPWTDLADKSLEDCKARIDKEKAQGWRLDHLYAYGAGSKTRFGAILIQDPQGPDWDVSWALTPAQYDAELGARKCRGFRPHTACGHDDDSGALRFSVIWIRYFDPVLQPTLALPRRASDVFGFLAGTWKCESTVVVPKLPADKARSLGLTTFDTVADGKFLRGYTSFEGGPGENLVVQSYDDEKDTIRGWFFLSNGEATGPGVGKCDADRRTIQWMERLPNGIQAIHQFDFVDAITLKTHLFHQDAKNNIVLEVRNTFTRLDQAVAGKRLPPDSKRPLEMQVLDRIIGNWRSEIIPNGSGKTAWRVRIKAQPILGGRLIEEYRTDETYGNMDYWLAGYDAETKKYRFWRFNSNGSTTEAGGTWDEAKQTLRWMRSDIAVWEDWKFRGANEREIAIGLEPGVGALSEGVSRKFVPVPGWGDWFDPSGDCRYEVKTGKLAVTIPAGNHEMEPKSKPDGKKRAGNQDAPRVLQDLEGDFTLQVKLADFPRLNKDDNGTRGAGLLLWLDHQTFLKFMIIHNYSRPITQLDHHFSVFVEGKKAAGHDLNADGPDPYLQIERRGQKLHLRTSPDGKKWADIRDPVTVWDMPNRLKAGIFAVRVNDDGPKQRTFMFEELQLIRPAAKSAPAPP